MRTIKILDTTLRDGEQSPGCTMHISEKLDLAKRLEIMGIDIIEAGFPVTSLGDYQAVAAIAKQVKNSEVCGLARALEADIQSAYDALKLAVAPRLHIFIATSKLHMLHKLKLTEDQVLSRIKDSLTFATKLMRNVQFSFEDATRSDKDFLLEAARTAVKYGAKCINFADTVGFTSPEEIADLVDNIRSNIDLDGIDLGVHCHNDLGMAVANSLTAIRHGATQIEGTINGIGERAGNASVEEIVMALKLKPDYNADTRVITKEIYGTSRLLSNIIGTQIPANKPIVGSNVFLHESGIHQHGVMLNPATYEIFTPEAIGLPVQQMVLGKHSGKHAFEEYLQSINKTYTPAELNTYFKSFKALCDKKKSITRLDIEAIISGGKMPAGRKVYTLKNFLIATQKDGAFATVTLTRGSTDIAYQESGNGALDSSFNAVNKILNVDFILIDYSLHAVTGGEDALGEAVVKLSNGTTTITGRGVSTDIVEASILAYLDSANKLLTE